MSRRGNFSSSKGFYNLPNIIKTTKSIPFLLLSIGFNDINVKYIRGPRPLVFRHIEIGNARNVEVKISKMFQKGFKLKFLKGYFKIFQNNIFIFQPYSSLKKFFKNLHFEDFTKKA